jgi:hypothetical protein
MIMSRIIEGSVYCKILIQVSHMISNNIDHHINIFGMTSLNEKNEIILGSKMII